MKFICNRKIFTHIFWSALVISTFVAGSLMCIRLFYGRYYPKEDDSLKGFSSRTEKLTEEKCISICESEECVFHAKFLLDRMEPMADPCENIFEFECGKFSERFTEHDSIRFAFPLVTHLHRTLKVILDNISGDPESSSGKLKTVYDSCIKQSSAEVLATPTILQQLEDFGIPNWPNLAPDFKFVEPNLIRILSNMLKYGEYGFVSIRTKHIPRDYPFLPVNATVGTGESAYEKKSNSSRKYRVEKVLQYFGVNSQAIDEMWKELEAVLTAVSHLKEESQRTYNEDKDADFSQLIDCAEDTEMKFACEILESFVDSAEVHSGVSKKFAGVYGPYVYYLQNILPVLSNFSDRVIANYLSINVVFSHLHELNLYFRLALQKDPGSLGKVSDRQRGVDHWRRCVDWLSSKMFIALSHVYLKQVLTAPVMEEAEDFIREIIEEVADSASSQEWINEDVRSNWAQKIRFTTNSIENLKDYLTNGTFLNDFYSEFHPTDANFLHNVFEHQRFSIKVEMLGFLQGTALLYSTSLLMPGASAGRGNLDIQLGLLAPPLYRIGLQRKINLVSLAGVIAHEVGHIMHFYTRKFKETDPAAKDFMDEKLKCIEDQYSQFKFQYIEKNMNGSQYVIENIADCVAISVIDKFIEKYSSTEDDAFMLPGLPYSLKQLLYISSVEVWCESYTKELEQLNYESSSHSPGKFRMTGMMMNSKGFAAAFNCPEGSYMNPSTKCLFPE